MALATRNVYAAQEMTLDLPHGYFPGAKVTKNEKQLAFEKWRQSRSQPRRSHGRGRPPTTSSRGGRAGSSSSTRRTARTSQRATAPIRRADPPPPARAPSPTPPPPPPPPALLRARAISPAVSEATVYDPEAMPPHPYLQRSLQKAYMYPNWCWDEDATGTTLRLYRDPDAAESVVGDGDGDGDGDEGAAYVVMRRGRGGRDTPRPGSPTDYASESRASSIPPTGVSSKEGKRIIRVQRQ